jgi:hypothetical protein
LTDSVTHEAAKGSSRSPNVLTLVLVAAVVALLLAEVARAATPAQADAKVIACFHKNHVAAKKTAPFPGVIATFPGYNHYHWYTLGWRVVNGRVVGALTAHSPLSPAELAIGRRCGNAWRR